MTTKSLKPKVTVNCGASRYSAPNERIIEYSFQDGSCGLIRFVTLDDGTPLVSLYRHDKTVKINVGKADG